METYDWNSDFVHVRHGPEVNRAQVFSMMDKLVGDARFDGLKYAIIDCLSVKSVGLTAEDSNLAGRYSRSLLRYQREKEFRVYFVATEKVIVEFLQQYIKIVERHNPFWIRFIVPSAEAAHSREATPSE